MMYKNFDVERAGRAEDVTEQFGFTMSPAGLKVRLRAATGALTLRETAAVRDDAPAASRSAPPP